MSENIIRVSVGSIKNHLLPYLHGQPAYVNFTGTDDIFVPVFSSIEKLKVAMLVCGVSYDEITKISDDIEFLDSMPPQLPSGTRIRVIVDPMQVENNNVTFAEVYR